jgi:hypothetical protein
VHANFWSEHTCGIEADARDIGDDGVGASPATAIDTMNSSENTHDTILSMGYLLGCCHEVALPSARM